MSIAFVSILSKQMLSFVVEIYKIETNERDKPWRI